MIWMVLIVRTEAAAFFVEVLQSALRRWVGQGKEARSTGAALVADVNDTGQVQIFIAVFTNRFVIDQGNLAVRQRQKGMNPLSRGDAPKCELVYHPRFLISEMSK